MAKQVTRGVIQFEHIFAKVKDVEGKVEVTEQVSFTLNEKMGTKKVLAFKKDHPELENHSLLMVQEKKVTYAMDLDAFIKNAVIIDEQ